jgi:flavin-dependent dehydrogenase
MKTDKIVIVGGGSAGWMTAATMVRAFPEKDITVIESPNIPSIGVGESTLGQIKKWTRYIGLDEKDFMPYTDATYKLSIMFTDFYKEGSGSFHYPFGFPERDYDGEKPFQQWYVAREYYPSSPQTDLVDLFFPGVQLCHNNTFNENKDGALGSFKSDHFIAYHFDAVRFGNWLREKYCLPRGVKHILGHVSDIPVNDSGVEKLILEDGQEIFSDLYIDCTGFRSLILGGALEEPFMPYSDILPNNSAWACQIPYKDKDKELQLFTNCTAIENGWCWNIPLWSRIGTGYNYSDKYVSDEDALEEFKNYLTSDKMVIPRTREEVDSYTFRNLKTRVGQHNKTFVKNVVAIGLSAGFIEPLESNGLYSVHEFLFQLVDILHRGEVSQLDRDMYNTQVWEMFDSFAKFVALHYAMSHRGSTKYWQDSQNRSYTEERNAQHFTQYHQRTNSFYQAGRKFFDVWENHNDLDGIVYISAGMNYRPMSGTRLAAFEDFNGKDGVREKSKNMYQEWNKRRDGWEKVAKNSTPVVEYMQKNFYTE